MSYNTVNSTYHIWLCSIATDKVLVEKQEENEILQEKITLLTLELKEREGVISQLMEKMKSKKTIKYIIEIIIIIIIRSTISNIRNQVCQIRVT